MNRKQGAIIGVLLALIVCAGVLATKLNSNLDYVAGNDMPKGKSTISFNDSTQNKSESSSLQESKLMRDNDSTTALQNLKAIIDDEHTSKEQRAELSKKYSNLALACQSQSQIETTLNSKGYKDTICYVQNNKVTVIIKSPKKLTETQQKQIQDVVMDVTHIKDVEIQPSE